MKHPRPFSSFKHVFRRGEKVRVAFESRSTSISFASLSPSLSATVLAGVFSLSFSCPRCGRKVELSVVVAPAPPEARDQLFQIAGSLSRWRVSLTPGFALVKHSDGFECSWRGRLRDGVLTVR